MNMNLYGWKKEILQKVSILRSEVSTSLHKSKVNYEVIMYEDYRVLWLFSEKNIS